MVGYCPLTLPSMVGFYPFNGSHVPSPSSTTETADVGLPGGRPCGRREGLAAGLHGAAWGGAWQQRGGDGATAGGQGQPGEAMGHGDEEFMGGIDDGYMMLKHGNKVNSFLIYV